jgi:small subunit ribosomal protein S20
MPHTRSAAKRARQSEQRRVRNKSRRSEMKSFVKKVQALADKGDGEGARKLLVVAYQRIDKAAQKGAIHANTASRRKSRLTLHVNKALTKAKK